MSIQHQSNWSLRSILSKPLLWFLGGLMSNHVKRLFYFASLYAYLLPVESLKSDVMGRLNSVMNLASSDDALMMPAVLSRVVWGKHDVSRILEQTETVHVELSPQANAHALEVRAYELVTLTSRWMRFGPIDQMKNETVKFLRFVDQFNTNENAVATTA